MDLLGDYKPRLRTSVLQTVMSPKYFWMHLLIENIISILMLEE